MTVPNAEQAVRHAQRLVAKAWALERDPNNMDVRRAFQQATFNIDWTAAAIVALAHMEPMEKPPEEA